MPKVQERIPEHLQPYVFHGVTLRWKDNGEGQSTGDCPFCGKEGKFSVNSEGQWRCLVCNEGEDKGSPIKGGNAVVFIRKLHEYSFNATQPSDYEVLARDRKLMNATTLVVWQACRSIITNDWMIPGYNVEFKMCQLYRYIGHPKRLLLPTPTLGHKLFMDSWDNRKQKVRILEGPWDAMAAWEVMTQVKLQGEQLVTTGNIGSSLFAECNLLAVPGCSTFLDPWFSLLKDKEVDWWYDSDHPKEYNGRIIEPAGWANLQRVASLALLNGRHVPKGVNYLHWGNNGYDPSLPSGYDVRDHLASSGEALNSRIMRFGELLGKVAVFSVDSGKSDGKASNREGRERGEKELKVAKCQDYKTVVNAWRKAMSWMDGLDQGLSSMLACVVSTSSIGDQLFLKVMSPPSTGKTTIAEGLGVARKYVRCVDTVRGFTSGYKLPDGTTSDLASDLDGMTLITLDGDTLQQLPNLPNILSEARRLYDGSLNSHFKNNTGKDVQGHRMTWIICGTSSLRNLDTSELGARFIDCVLMDRIDDEMEDNILMQAAYKAEANVSVQVKSGMADSHRDRNKTEAMKLTGGYVNYLRENAEELLSGVSMSENCLRLCTRYGKFVAYMRARPSKTQEEIHEREMAARLVSILTRLAKCYAAVMNKSEVDSEVMRRTRQRTLDTSRGSSLEIVEQLYQHETGLETKGLGIYTGRDESKLRVHLKYLRHIGIVELSKAELKAGVVSKSLWTLTPRLRRLYAEVMENEIA